MKKFKISILLSAALMVGVSLASCSDADEYADTDTSNPVWGDINGSIAHPDSLTNTTWTRGTGMKTNAYGEDVQGFVESIQFTDPDSCIVKMSEPTYPSNFDSSKITWTDQSNTESTPKYEYTYSNTTGKLEIKSMVKDDKGKVSKTTIFSGIAVSGVTSVLTVTHYGDTPVQTYLVKK